MERRDFEPGGDAFFYHAGANLLADGQGLHLAVLLPGAPRASGRAPAALHRVPRGPFGARHAQRAHAPAVVVRARHRNGGARRAARARPSAVTRSASSRPSSPRCTRTSGRPTACCRPRRSAMFTTTLAVCARVPVSGAAELAAARVGRRGVRTRRAGAFGARAAGAAARRAARVARPVPNRGSSGGSGSVSRSLATVVLIAPWSDLQHDAIRAPDSPERADRSAARGGELRLDLLRRVPGLFRHPVQRGRRRRGGTDRLSDDESQRGIADRRAALHYIRGHLGRLPHVEGVRLLRIVGSTSRNARSSPTRSSRGATNGCA